MTHRHYTLLIRSMPAHMPKLQHDVHRTQRPTPSPRHPGIKSHMQAMTSVKRLHPPGPQDSAAEEKTSFDPRCQESQASVQPKNTTDMPLLRGSTCPRNQCRVMAMATTIAATAGLLCADMLLSGAGGTSNQYPSKGVFAHLQAGPEARLSCSTYCLQPGRID